MIHICYGLYDRDGHYSKFVGTSMTSVFENTGDEITVHLLHDNTLNADNRDKFIYLVGKYGQQIKFYNVEVLAADRIAHIKNNLSSILQSNYSIATLYRLLIPSLVKADAKVIYIDADIIANRDVRDIWNIPLNDHPLAAMPEFACGVKFSVDKYLITSGAVVGDDYINAGLMLLNLKYLREHENEIWDKGYAFVTKHPECRYFDQDILNYCFSKNYVKLTPDFNRFVDIERVHHKPCVVRPHIYHFLSNSFNADLDDCFNRLYFSYFVKTPWFGADAFGNAFKAVENSFRAQQNSMLSMIRLLGKRDRAFFTEHNNIPAVKALFEIGDQEMIVDASNSDALMKILNALRPLNGQRKKIFFIFSGNYLAFKNFLVSQKFVEGIDFVNAMPFVSHILGMPTESHSIVRAM
ncbi:MAG: hypothetical protein IJ668_02845 [Selenomonadaceae bacterium]|nr:hypothetical protein [Selenomonadaceae bacterium]